MCAIARFRHRRFGRRPPPDPSGRRSSVIQLTHIFDRRAGDKRARFADGGVVVDDVDRRRPAQRRGRGRRSDRRPRAGGRLDSRARCSPASRWSPRTSRSIARRGARAPDAGCAPGTAAAVRGRGRRRDADRPRDRRRPGRRSHHTHRRDPERHDQRRAVADGGDAGCARRTRWPTPRPRGICRSRPVRRSRRRRCRAKLAILCALAFGLRVDAGSRSRRARPRASIGSATSRGRGAPAGTIRQIAHADYDRATANARPPGSRRSAVGARLDLRANDWAAERGADHRRPLRARSASLAPAPAATPPPSRCSATSPPSRATARPSCRRRSCRDRLSEFEPFRLRTSDFRFR